MTCKKPIFAAATTVSLLALTAGGASSDNQTTGNTNIYGTPGNLIDMPTAEMAEEGQMSTTVSIYGAGSNNQTTRTTLSFQVLPRVSASFRYSGIGGLVPDPGRPTFSTLYDRSFDLRFRLVNEGRYMPAIALGLQDFIGTGIYGGEYLVATKSIGPRLRFSGGIGWGRFGSSGAFGATGTRPKTLLGEGGIPTYDRWFRGDVAAFAGASYEITDKLTFSAEYSLGRI